MIAERLEKLVEEMVEKGVRFEDAIREFEKRFIVRVLDRRDGSLTKTAAALGIHRNTLTYRLRQIAQLLGHDPDDPRLRLAIHLALVAERLPNELRVEG